jgi:hypothetical protein
MDHHKLVELWSKAQVLSLGPTWRGEPEATALVEQVVADWPEARDKVIDLLSHPVALVAAHALLCLRRADDPILLTLDAALFESTGSVSVQEGSFRTASNLGSLARKWAKQARAARAPGFNNK